MSVVISWLLQKGEVYSTEMGTDSLCLQVCHQGKGAERIFL